jgi:hypothetical protein
MPRRCFLRFGLVAPAVQTRFALARDGVSKTCDPHEKTGAMSAHAICTRRAVDVLPFNVTINVRGTLELGRRTDPETGSVDLVNMTGTTCGRT